MTATRKAIATMSIRKMISSAVSSISRGSPIQVRNSLMAFSRAWANRFVFITVCALNRCAGVLRPYWVFVRLRGMRPAAYASGGGCRSAAERIYPVFQVVVSLATLHKICPNPFPAEKRPPDIRNVSAGGVAMPANPESRKSWKPCRVLSAYFHGCFYQNLNSYGKTE